MSDHCTYRFQDCTTIVSRDGLEKVYALMQMSGTGAGASQNALLDADEFDPEQCLHVVDSMKMPRWLYSAERKTFERWGASNSSAKFD